MKFFLYFLSLLFVSVWCENTHTFDFNIKIEGSRAERIFSENKIHAKMYDFGYNEANSEATIKRLESISLNEETDIVLIKRVTSETKELIKRTYGHKFSYVYDDFTCGDAMILSQFKVLKGDVTHTTKNQPAENNVAQSNGQHHLSSVSCKGLLAGIFTMRQNTRQQVGRALQCQAAKDKNESSKDYESSYNLSLGAKESITNGPSVDFKATYERDYNDGTKVEISSTLEAHKNPDGKIDTSGEVRITIGSK